MPPKPNFGLNFLYTVQQIFKIAAPEVVGEKLPASEQGKLLCMVFPPNYFFRTFLVMDTSQALQPFCSA